MKSLRTGEGQKKRGRTCRGSGPSVEGGHVGQEISSNSAVIPEFLRGDRLCWGKKRVELKGENAHQNKKKKKRGGRAEMLSFSG